MKSYTVHYAGYFPCSSKKAFMEMDKGDLNEDIEIRSFKDSTIKYVGTFCTPAKSSDEAMERFAEANSGALRLVGIDNITHVNED